MVFSVCQVWFHIKRTVESVFILFTTRELLASEDNYNNSM